MSPTKNVCMGGYCKTDESTFSIQNIDCFVLGVGMKLGIVVHD